ncbi:MAG: porin [Succinivibrio sp.]
MKKSLLAIAIASVGFAGIANAATVYDKDGTSLKIDGRVQSVLYNGNWESSAGENDASLQNSARFGVGGKTKAGIFNLEGYSQWDMADANVRTGNNIKARDQFVQIGVDNFGALKLGRYKGAINYVTKITDVFDDFGCEAQSANDERNSGRIEYTYKLGGLEAILGFVTANDTYRIEHAKGKEFKIENAFSGALGYTFEDIGIGPLSLRAGYEVVDGQNDDYPLAEGALLAVPMNETFDKATTYVFGVALGNPNNGFYTAADYTYRNFDYYTRVITLADAFKDKNEDLKVKGFEYVIAYTFDCGLSLKTGYNAVNYSQDHISNKNINGVKVYQNLDNTIQTIPAYINYNFNPNFNVWAEARFSLSNKDDLKAVKKAGITSSYNVDKNVLSLGARYSF